MLEGFIDKDLPPEEQWSELYSRVLSSAEMIELEEAIEWLSKIERWKQGHERARAELDDLLDGLAERFREYLESDPDASDEHE